MIHLQSKKPYSLWENNGKTILEIKPGIILETNSETIPENKVIFKYGGKQKKMSIFGLRKSIEKEIKTIILNISDDNLSNFLKLYGKSANII